MRHRAGPKDAAADAQDIARPCCCGAGRGYMRSPGWAEPADLGLLER